MEKTFESIGKTEKSKEGKWQKGGAGAAQKISVRACRRSALAIGGGGAGAKKYTYI